MDALAPEHLTAVLTLELHPKVLIAPRANLHVFGCYWQVIYFFVTCHDGPRP